MTSGVKVNMITDLTVAETSVEEHRSTHTFMINLATGETDQQEIFKYRRQMNGERWMERKSEW